MLGKLVADEIVKINHEKECHCPGCAVNQSIRTINIYMAQNQCECPVCSMTHEMLHEQAEKLQNLLDKHMELSAENERAANSVLHVPPRERQERIAVELEQRGAILALAMALAGTVKRFTALCDAAHRAYAVVETSTNIRQKISDLIRSHKEPSYDMANEPRNSGGFNVN
jgi:hypothetical protein